MAEVAIVQRLDCAHCEKTGTCRSGPDGASCAVCVRSARISQQSAIGLVCSICRGIGTAEPDTLKLLNMFVPIFAAAFVGLLLLLIAFFAWLRDGQFFQPFLTFAATAVGSVTGYYFGGSKQHISSVVEQQGPRAEAAAPAAQSHGAA